MFCKGNVTDGFGVFGAKCEGKSTMFAESKKIGICEGAFQSFGKKGFKTPGGKFIKSTKAYGCLGTAISVSSNSSNSIGNQAGLMTDGFRPEDAVAVDMALEGWCSALPWMSNSYMFNKLAQLQRAVNLYVFSCVRNITPVAISFLMLLRRSQMLCWCTS